MSEAAYAYRWYMQRVEWWNAYDLWMAGCNVHVYQGA